MILPTKYVPPADSVIGRAGLALSLRDDSPTVNGLWNAFRMRRPDVPFDSFVEALTLLFLMGIVRIDSGILRWEV
ncbi:hypothetical protein LFM56_11920 [Cellulomonas iranensis]|uniref:ABC-three component system middle component 6 n=1 Tax=Cellulomonas iranensis TaxID=76862 RepID=UPI001CF5F7C1|nr:ABC-three component system middle component 6 [Cellulomonas iranensis]UCN13612.1 hypothetical protein LFM56_11920 [Cellulomonas iranensis]